MNKLELIDDGVLERKLKRHLDRRELPDAFLYTGLHGARSWLSLESSTRFQVAATLTTLMREYAPAIAWRIGPRRTVVSIGAGDAQKELLLLKDWTENAKPLCHIVDVSRQLVDEALKNLSPLGIETRGTVAFCEDLDALAPNWERPVLLCLLGNNFCNYDPSTLLPLFHRNLDAADLLLFDGSMLPDEPEDIRQWVQEVESIYNSPQNVRFNVAPLVTRGVDPEGCRFELKLITVNSPAGPIYRTRKRIHVTKPAVVQCGTEAVSLAAGDTIEMGFTYKYRLDQLRQCLNENGFEIVECWPDQAGGNAILLVQKRNKETKI
jgi:uncharacterized SAM-dependent methyltransferase